MPIKNLLRCFLTVALITIAPRLWAQTSAGSVTWAQFSVEKDGVYKISFDDLKKAGYNPDQIDPRKIQLFSFPTGMLPQSNSASRAGGLQEMAILVTGEEDGQFNNGDQIIFYGQGPDIVQYNDSKK